jgi:hypothetical protein
MDISTSLEGAVKLNRQFFSADARADQFARLKWLIVKDRHKIDANYLYIFGLLMHSTYDSWTLHICKIG